MNLKYLVEGQADAVDQYNRVIQILEVFSFLNVLGTNIFTPPGSPNNGEAWTIGSGPTGAWADHPLEIAIYYDGWIFKEPFIGLVLWDIPGKDHEVYNGTNWEQVPPKLPAQADLNQTITGPSVAEVQAITDKLDALINSMDGAGYF